METKLKHSGITSQCMAIELRKMGMKFIVEAPMAIFMQWMTNS